MGDTTTSTTGQADNGRTFEAFLVPYHGTDERLRAIIEPALLTMRLELIQLTHVKTKFHDTLRLFVDKLGVGSAAAGGDGISMAELERANRVLSDLLDVEDTEQKLFSHAYDLEVGSPGLDRPLTKKSHFASAIGKRVKIRTQMPLENGSRGASGTLKSVADDAFVVDADGGEAITFQFENVSQAQVIYVFEMPQKKKARATPFKSAQKQDALKAIDEKDAATGSRKHGGV